MGPFDDANASARSLELPVLELEAPADAELFEPGPCFVIRVRLPEPGYDANGSPVE